RAPGWLYQAQIRERIEQQPADQKFDRQIIDSLLLLPLGFGACLQPDADDAVAHRQWGRLIPMIVAARVRKLAQFTGELGADPVAKLGLASVTVGLRGPLLA